MFCELYTIYKRKIWESGSSGSVHFHAKDIREKYLGRIAEDDYLQSSLYKSLTEKEFSKNEFEHKVDFLFDSTVTDINVKKSNINCYGPAELLYKQNNSENKLLTARSSILNTFILTPLI